MGNCCSSSSDLIEFNDLNRIDDIPKEKSDPIDSPVTAAVPNSIVQSNSKGSVQPLEEELPLNPKDFYVARKEKEIIIREPGKIRGQAFAIDECKNCDIFLLDNSAAITIDYCEDCRFFLGPCESSVFIRDSKRCSFIVAAQQIRLRDCSSISLLAYVSASQPIIETSEDIKLGCFSYNYFSLAQQFKAAGLNVWDSQWSNIYDFNKGQSNDKSRNWSFLPPSTSWKEFGMKDLAEVTEGRIRLIAGFATPNTWGTRPHTRRESAFVAILPGHEDIASSLLEVLEPALSYSSPSATPSLYLLQTRFVKASDLKSFPLKGLTLPTTLSSGVIGMEFNGEEACKQLNLMVQEKNWLSSAIVVSASEDVQHNIQVFFQTIKI